MSWLGSSRSGTLSTMRNRRPVAFQPFRVAPFFAKARTWNSWWLLVLWPLFMLGAMVVTRLEGTLGGVEDLHPWSDLLHLVDTDTSRVSEPHFPFLRDATTWILLFVVSATCAIVHRQWQQMEDCLPKLLETGVLEPSPADGFANGHPRFLLVKWLRRIPPVNRYPTLVRQINKVMQIVGWYSIVPAFAALLVALLIVLGENRNGLFEALAPDSLVGVNRAEWVKEAYESWWASISHPFGFVYYVLIAFFGIFVILLQNIVGVAAVYVALSLRHVAELNVDWLNRDGRFGWRPFARIYRTVCWSLALHGSALSLMVLVLGTSNFWWMMGLVAIWVVFAPLYTIVPILVARRIANLAREKRVLSIAGKFDSLGGDPLEMGRYQDEIGRTLNAKVRLLRADGPMEVPAILVGVFLPIVLTVAQILATFIAS